MLADCGMYREAIVAALRAMMELHIYETEPEMRHVYSELNNNHRFNSLYKKIADYYPQFCEERYTDTVMVD